MALLGLGIVGLNLLARQLGHAAPDDLGQLLFLLFAGALLNMSEVRIDRGRLTLTGIVCGTAAVLLNPLHATLVGLGSSIGLARRGPGPIAVNAIVSAWIACLGSVVAAQLHVGGALPLGSRVVAIVATSAANLLTVAVALSVRTGESPRSIVRHNFTSSFYFAFGYFALAALLLSYVLDGSLLGFVLATIVCVLSLALTDTIAGRRVSSTAGPSRASYTTSGTTWPTLWATSARSTPAASTL